jgi:hypothetical protein
MQKENVLLHQPPLLRVAKLRTGIVGHYQDPIHSNFNNKCFTSVSSQVKWLAQDKLFRGADRRCQAPDVDGSDAVVPGGAREGATQ